MESRVDAAAASRQELLLERVAAVVPAIAERGREAEHLRRLPDATLDDLRSTGVFAALVPSDRGGEGLGLDTIVALGRTLGRGCTSTAWVTTFLVMHNWLLSMFPDDVVDEVFGGRGYALAPAALSPTGEAIATGDGYRVSGRWSWATGVAHGDWVLVTGVVPGEGFDIRMVLLERDQVAVDDVWHTDGMRATGSNDVVADDVFVPSERTISFLDLVEGTAGAVNGHDDELLRLPLIPALSLTAAAPLIGGAEGALAAFRERLVERVLAYSLGERQAEKPSAQIRLALADADIRASVLLLENGANRLADAYAGGGSLARPERSGFRIDTTRAVHLAKAAVASLCDSAGGSIHLLDQPLQRFQRDLFTGSAHAVFDQDRAAETHGRVLAGLEPGVTDML